jgi:hypothetical protein
MATKGSFIYNMTNPQNQTVYIVIESNKCENDVIAMCIEPTCCNAARYVLIDKAAIKFKCFDTFTSCYNALDKLLDVAEQAINKDGKQIKKFLNSEGFASPK